MTRKFSELVAEGKEAKERHEQFEKTLAWCKNEKKRSSVLPLCASRMDLDDQKWVERSP